MHKLSEVLEDLERQDLHRLLKKGMPEEVELEIKVLCAEYQSMAPETQRVMRSATTRKATPILLIFASHMAELAMQRKDKDALDVALVAFDLSNIMVVDFRDAFGIISRLAFSAEKCGVNLIDHATAVISDRSPRLMEMLERPTPPRVARNGDGSLVFWSSWRQDTLSD